MNSDLDDFALHVGNQKVKISAGFSPYTNPCAATTNQQHSVCLVFVCSIFLGDIGRHCYLDNELPFSGFSINGLIS